MAVRRSLFFRLSRVWARRVQRRTRAPLGDIRRRIATGVGAVLLALAALAFAAAGNEAQRLFASLARRWWWLPLILSPGLFAFSAWFTRRLAPDATGSGIPQVIAAIRAPGRKAAVPLTSLRTALVKIAMTLTVLLGGASVGREGPTVQLSAALMVTMHRLLQVRLTAGVLIAGGAAGVAAAFNTPLAGIAFAMEELAITYEQRVAVLVMGAVMIAGLTSLGIAGDYLYFGALNGGLMLGQVIVLAPIAGVLGGLLGGGFSRIILHFVNATTGVSAWLKNHAVTFAALCGLVVAVTGIATGGATFGTGYATTRALVEGGPAAIWFGPTKFIAALATTLSGVPGGIFAPSLAVGAGFGSLLSQLAPGHAGGAVVLLGMVAYFVGVVRAPLTAVIILMEATASRSAILPLFATALIADWISAQISPTRLYHGLAAPFLARMGLDREGRPISD